MFRTALPLAILGILSICAAPATADVTLPHIISNHMVLQRDLPLPIWGWAAPYEDVTVSIAGQALTTKADDAGRWQVRLAALQTSHKPLEMQIAGKNIIKLENILVGEVWFCSGQSNMEFGLSQAANGGQEIPKANHPSIRLFGVPKATALQPAKDTLGRWQVCTPDTAQGFSGVGYFFGLDLLRKLNVPIGLIDASWGGTRIEPWTPAEAFADFPQLRDIAEQVQRPVDQRSNEIEPELTQLQIWTRLDRQAKATGQSTPPVPNVSSQRLYDHSRPTTLYNGMVAGVVPFGIRGAIWYQGESNIGDGMLCLEKMKAMIGGWRKAWGQGECPFYYVQIAPYRSRPNVYLLPEIWEAQTAALSIPNTGMAVTNDIGDTKDIHPKNKQDVGKRLALWALAKTYEHALTVYSGPLYRSMTIEGNRIRVRFDHIGGGLTSRDGQPLTWFEIAGSDGKFVEADARIDGDTVIVSSEAVAEPRAVRFAWNQIATPNLMNREGLPAPAFRSDGPLATLGRSATVPEQQATAVGRTAVDTVATTRASD